MNLDADYYAMLEVDPGCGFGELKKAYYRRAMDCHPDRFAGHPGKEREFKDLVEAFNILSDPLQRRIYDQGARERWDWSARVGPDPVYYFPEDADSILDTHADDILEELIVGNTLPANTCLQTLLRDLESTDRFCLFREGKNHFYNKQHAAAAGVFRQYLVCAPGNILAHYFLGRCYARTHQWNAAVSELTAAVRIGTIRQPPLRLTRMRRELAGMRRNQLGFLARLREAFTPPPPPDPLASSAEEMRREVSRAMTRMLIQDRRRRHPRLPG
jgi:molecular chaperone DnaJ